MYVVEIVGDVLELCRMVYMLVPLYLCVGMDTSAHSSMTESSDWLYCSP